MTAQWNPIVVLPARLGATRLPAKPLADIHGEPMIVHVWRRAMAAGIGRVVVACAEAAIGEAIERAGGQWVLTRPDHPSGSDRVFEAVSLLDPEERHDVVVNLQGDLPTIAPEAIRAALDPLAEPTVAIATVAAEIKREDEIGDRNVVKVAMGLGAGARIGHALYFSRNPVPAGSGPYYHHIGLYAFRRAALKRFVGLPQTPLEKREALEQLRALEDGMRIGVALVDMIPIGVDTPADLARARDILR
ncbi:MAG: 3-deoxy-manno-octulosonate cytidylyltransferase [Pseudomonadota bacterium]